MKRCPDCGGIGYYESPDPSWIPHAQCQTCCGAKEISEEEYVEYLKYLEEFTF